MVYRDRFIALYMPVLRLSGVYSGAQEWPECWINAPFINGFPGFILFVLSVVNVLHRSKYRKKSHF